MNKRLALFLLPILLGVCDSAFCGTPVKYWIMFKNKTGTPYSIEQPSAFLSDKSITRRTRYAIPLHHSDLPVTPEYITQVAAVANVKVLYSSKWLNGLVIQLDSIELASAALIKIKAFSFVSDTIKVKKLRLNLPTPQNSIPTHNSALRQASANNQQHEQGYDYGNSIVQNQQIGVDCLHQRGFRGQGMTIAVLDAGFAFVDSNPVFDSLLNRGGIVGMRDFVSGGNNAFQGGTHGTMVLSCMAANAPGIIIGSAPMADYWLFRTEAPEENIIEEYNWIRGAEFADSVGVDILTTSLGYTDFDDPAMNHTYSTLNGRTAPMSIAATMAARKGLFVLNAAGNDRANPWHFIGVPADADSICTVGAVDGNGVDAAFSSVGPTADGRIKPDLMSQGAGTHVSVNTATSFPGNGTSFATPVLAGAVACYWQLYRDKNNMKVLNDLKRSASLANNPNNNYGWGIPNMCPMEPFDFNAYCDPETAQITINVTESVYEEIIIEVVDLNGKILFSEKVDAGYRTFVIDAGILADSVYLVTLRTSNGTSSKKILKR